MAGGAPSRLGVVGAGTMGAGIAQLGVLAGMETVLYDAFPEALQRGRERIEEGLRKGAERGRWSEDDASAARARLRTGGELADLSNSERRRAIDMNAVGPRYFETMGIPLIRGREFRDEDSPPVSENPPAVPPPPGAQRPDPPSGVEVLSGGDERQDHSGCHGPVLRRVRRGPEPGGRVHDVRDEARAGRERDDGPCPLERALAIGRLRQRAHEVARQSRPLTSRRHEVYL